MFINFSDIPDSPNIFLDYLYEFENVAKFYPTNFRNENDIKEVLSKVKKTEKERERIVSILREQNPSSTVSSLTSSNIETLISQNSFAVITGQQLGFATGPLYTIYKTITAIKLAQSLSEKHTNYEFVPIFWLEGDDHDFEEVRSIKVLDNENSISTISYDDGLDSETNRGPIGDYTFDLMVEQNFEQLRASLRETEFKNSILALLAKHYYAGASFKSAFVGLMREFFDEYGLILFDPQSAKVKDTLRPVFKKDVEQFRFIAEELITRSANLEEVYHAQVKIKPINLFYIEDGGRYSVEPTEIDFRLKGKRKKFTIEELFEQIDFFPEKISPNVILRPICQDYLFPTAFYIGGPAEISYHAQIVPYYEILNLTQPILYPRASATIIESRVQQILDKHNLQLQDFFYDNEQLALKIADSSSEIKVTDIFSRVEKEFSAVFDRLSEDISMIDQTLSDVVSGAKLKTEQYVQGVRERALAAQKRKNEVIFRQIYKTSNVLYPDDDLQERELSFIYFVNKYGLDFIKFIYKNLEIDKFEHQIIKL
jgi:bacillithiol biosynthesis cysteine-adding enzyme BshC